MHGGSRSPQALSGDDSKVTTRQFFYSSDGMRGIAALLVVLRHAAPYFRPIDFQESYLAVDVFFRLEWCCAREFL